VQMRRVKPYAAVLEMTKDERRMMAVGLDRSTPRRYRTSTLRISCRRPNNRKGNPRCLVADPRQAIEDEAWSLLRRCDRAREDRCGATLSLRTPQCLASAGLGADIPRSTEARAAISRPWHWHASGGLGKRFHRTLLPHAPVWHGSLQPRPPDAAAPGRPRSVRLLLATLAFSERATALTLHARHQKRSPATGVLPFRTQELRDERGPCRPLPSAGERLGVSQASTFWCVTAEIGVSFKGVGRIAWRQLEHRNGLEDVDVPGRLIGQKATARSGVNVVAPTSSSVWRLNIGIAQARWMDTVEHTKVGATPEGRPWRRSSDPGTPLPT